MTPDKCRPSARSRWRIVIPVLLLFALSVVIVSLLPASAPVALADRLFQSPVQTPVVPQYPTPTSIPVQPTTPPAVPGADATSSPEPSATTPATEVTGTPDASLPGAEAEESTETGERRINWARAIDLAVVAFSYIWLVCGVVVALLVVVILIVLYVRSKRLRQS